MPKTKSQKQKKPTLTAKNADPHVLYQESVQDAESEAAFLRRAFKKLRGRDALSLREDFCGTALLCAEWVKKKGRTAVGIDLDPQVLAWGIEHNLKPLGEGEPGERVRLLQQNVLDRAEGPFDLAVGLNFSYFIFKTRDELRAYFTRARKSLAKDGVFFVDAYGGNDSWRTVREPRRQKGFKYVWDQSRVDPINNHVLNHIHFEFPDGSKLNRAFTYDWRLWTLPEIREVLMEAGFLKTSVWWEDADEDGEGSGVFRERKRVEQELAWVAYIVAEQ